MLSELPTVALFAVFKQYEGKFIFLAQLEGTARYAGLLLAPAEGFGLRPRPFFDLRAKKDLFMSVLAQILEFLVISSNLSKF